jgi:C-type mannose receptor
MLAAGAVLCTLAGCNQIAGIEPGKLDPEGCGAGAESEGDRCAAQTPGSCPSSWSQDPVGGACFRFEGFEGTRTDWDSARQRCQQLGGDLASIHGPSELAFTAALARRDAWIGGTNGDEGVMHWSDGSPWSYAPWAEDAHLGGKQICVSLQASESVPVFEDRDCGERLSFLCKRSP